MGIREYVEARRATLEAARPWDDGNDAVSTEYAKALSDLWCDEPATLDVLEAAAEWAEARATWEAERRGEVGQHNHFAAIDRLVTAENALSNTLSALAGLDGGTEHGRITSNASEGATNDDE